MAEKYVERIKSASSGEIYTIRDPQTATKQDLLVSGTNIKTINNQSVLGSGNIEIEAGGAVDSVNGQTGTVVLTASDVGAQETLVSGTNIKTINGVDILGSGDIEIGGGGGGTDNYNNLSNKPAINGTTLAGDKALSEFGIQAEITSESKLSSELVDGIGTMAAETATDYTKTANLAAVALSNQYSDLTGTPTLGTMASETAADYTKTANLAAVATSNQYSDLTGTPTFKTINSTTITGSGDIDTIEKVTVTPNRNDGGFVAGTTYTDMTFAEFAETLLNPYQAPGATITLSPTTAHKGTATNITATLKATKNSKALTVATLQVGSGTAETVASLIPNGGTANQTATGLTATTVFTFVVGDGTQSVTKTATVNFNEYKYHGIVDVAPADVTATLITGLTTDYSTAAKGYTYSSITMTNQRVCYAYPASYGNLTLIKDKNGYDVTGSYTKTTVEVDGISYNVYTMTDTGSLSNGSMQFS